MGKPITIWQLGNTGLRNPMRIWEGLKLFAESPFNGNLRGSNEERFQTLLNHAGLVNSTGEAEDTSSYARKWRLMFARFGFILLYLVVFRFGLTECLEIEKRWYFNAFAIL